MQLREPQIASVPPLPARLPSMADSPHAFPSRLLAFLAAFRIRLSRLGAGGVAPDAVDPVTRLALRERGWRG